jgi:hypothetical protein
VPNGVLKRTESQSLSGGDMKRTATTLVLLAGLGGSGCISPDQQAQKGQPAGGFGTVTRGKQVNTVQGPLGEPVMATARSATPGAVRPGSGTLFGEGAMIRPASDARPAYANSRDGVVYAMVPGVGGKVIQASGFGASGPYGPQVPNMPTSGIVPVPTMGPPGAVAGFGAIGVAGGAMPRPMMANGRTSINFTGPAGMKVTWQLPDGSFNDEAGALTAPKEYNFLQGQIYRLRLTSILPDHPGKSFYPTLEVAPPNPKTLTFLAHSSVPITFAPDDFTQARAGNLVVKVVYLPDPANQDFSTAIGAEEVVSTRLGPGEDPVAEAQRRGTVLAVIRLGNIDLENRVSPAMTAPPPGLMPPLGPPRPIGPGGPPPMGPGGPPPGGAFAPIGPTNPPGTATVRPPSTLPPLPPSAPTDLPPIPVGPGPVAPKAKTK